MDWWATTDAQTKAGIIGQLMGHGFQVGTQVLRGAPLNAVVNSNTLMWAGFSLASEYLTGVATRMAATPIGGVVAPAAVQYAALSMYDPRSKAGADRILNGDMMGLLASPALAGTVGSIIAKSYA